MARRNGRKGDYLFSDYYSGCAVYASKTQEDYWGDSTAEKTLKRNLQEISTPLNDPYPVPFYSGPQYEATNGCIGEVIPATIGTTNIPFPTNSAAVQSLGLNPGIGQASIGCSFEVR